MTKQKDEKVMKIQGNHHTGRVTNTGPMKPLLGKRKTNDQVNSEHLRGSVLSSFLKKKYAYEIYHCNHFKCIV